MKKFYVYKITNIINNKIYIGKSIDPKSRFATHKYAAISNNKSYKKLLLHKSIKKYGKENFKMEIIGEYDSESAAFEYEKHFILIYKSNIINFGYNMTDGGEGASGWMMPEEIKEKLSKDRMGENNPMYNHPASEITRQKMIKSQSNRKERKKHSFEIISLLRNKRKERSSYKETPPISKEIRDKIIEMYNSCKYTKKQISEITEVKYHTVSWVIRKRNVPRYPNLIPKQIKDKVLELKNNGISIKETSALLNISIGKVNNIRRKPRQYKRKIK